MEEYFKKVGRGRGTGKLAVQLYSVLRKVLSSKSAAPESAISKPALSSVHRKRRKEPDSRRCGFKWHMNGVTVVYFNVSVRLYALAVSEYEAFSNSLPRITAQPCLQDYDTPSQLHPVPSQPPPPPHPQN